MSEPRSKAELREEFKKLRRSYHTVTCGELREIFRRYRDKEIYLIDSNGNEVPGGFHRIHDFLYSFRWELHPLSEKGILANVQSIGMTRGPGSSDEVRYLSREAFGMWGYIDVPVYVCDTADYVDPRIPAFSEYTLCGDRVVFRRSREAYVKYDELLKEWNKSVRIEAEMEAKRLTMRDTTIELPQVRRSFPTLFADMLVGVSPATKAKEK
jgi:hypothetical protein